MNNTLLSKKLNDWIQFLNQNKKLTFMLLTIYSFLIIKLHNPLVNVSVFVMKRMSIQGYNTFISSLSFLALVVLLSIFIIQMKKHQEILGIKLALLFGIVSILMIHYVYLLEMNIEIIHAFAYGGLIFLFFAFFKRWTPAVIFSIPIMLLDEWNQYINLYPTYVEYWELNDVILDILGENFVLFFLFSMNIKPDYSKVKWFKRSEFIFGLSLICFFSILTLTGIFAIHQSQARDYTQFVMSRLQNFDVSWHVHGLTKKVYYILNPKEAMGIIVVFCVTLFYLDSTLAKE